MRDLVGMGLAESGTAGDTFDISLASWPMAIRANIGNS